MYRILYGIIFGNVSFPQSEEYAEFRYKFLVVLMLLATVVTGAFVVGEYTKLNRIDTPHLVSMQLFTATTVCLWLILRGRKHHFQWVAWVYEIVCLMEDTSSLWFVPADELRVMWFFINIPGVFILLGARAGWLITIFTMIWLIVSNNVMPIPYSENAMATAIFSLLYLAASFHVFVSRSVSYFLRMRASNQQLEYMANHDTLTGVLNARAYYAACDDLIAIAARTGQPYGVLFVDLDHFKSINDTHGHAAGDAVLQAVAKCLGQSIRQTDKLGRIGGEEFSIYAPNTNRAGALALAEVLRQSVEGLNPRAGEKVLRITASIGVAVCEGVAEPMQAIQQKADESMYVAKSLGRNRVSALE